MSARPLRFSFVLVLAWLAPSARAQSPAALMFDPFRPPFDFHRPAPAKVYQPRFSLQLNPGPFASKYLHVPDAAPREPRDSPFDLRGDLQNDGLNTRAFWNATADLDLAVTFRLTGRTGMTVGYSPAARGRFTPRDNTAPALYFLQIRRSW